MLSLLDIQALTNKRLNDNKKRKTPLPPYCYNFVLPGRLEVRYNGKLKSMQPSEFPGYMNCEFDQGSYTNTNPTEKMFMITDCLEDYEKKKQAFMRNKQRIKKELNNAVEACAKEKCGKEKNARRKTHKNLMRNGTNSTYIQKNIKRFYGYDDCMTEKCNSIQKQAYNHMSKGFTLENYKAYGTRKNGWFRSFFDRLK